MIITCPSCQRKFELDDNLLPENGRTLQCGSCNYKWFFKKKDEIKVFEKQLVSNENEKIDNLYTLKNLISTALVIHSECSAAW